MQNRQTNRGKFSSIANRLLTLPSTCLLINREEAQADMIIPQSWKEIALEPVYFLFYFIETSSAVVYNNLLLQKACRYNQTEEPNLRTSCDDEKYAIVFVSSTNSWIKSVDLFVMIIFAVLASAWSDRSGKKRKPLLLLSLTGLLTESALGCVFSYLWTLPPLVAALGQLFSHAFNGGRVNFFFTSNMFISDITNEKNRTFRLTLITMMRFMAIPIGNAASGFLISSVGFFYTFLLNACVSCVALLWVVLFVVDRRVKVEKSPTVLDVLNPSFIVESAGIVFRKRSDRRRLVLVLLLIVNVLATLLKDGELSVLYLYFRYRFQWDERQFGIYAAYQNVGIFVGLFLSSVVLSRYYQVHDGVIGAFAAFWDIVASICYMFATQNWQLYLIPCMDIFHGAAYIMAKPFLTKVVGSDEYGHLSSMMALTCLVIPLGQPLYNLVFQMTIDSFSSAFYLLSMVISSFVCIFYGICYGLMKQ